MSDNSLASKINVPDLAELKERMKNVPWQEWVAKYSTPALWRSLWQTISSLGLYALAWVVLYQTLSISYWLTLALMPLAAGVYTRIFIINHDCGHGSFFKSQRANHILGFITATITFTPYFRWRHEHAIHHKNAGDLDHRDTGGDVWTMTVEEYLAATPQAQRKYRLYRNPIMMFILGPTWLFVIYYRFRRMDLKRRERMSVIWTNLALLALHGSLALWIGWKAVIMIQMPLFFIAGGFGVWLFFVQHQFEDVIWTREDDWDFAALALFGSSFYKLPKLIQWFSGNIGFHHIHHLSPRIPNYFLEKAHNNIPFFQTVRTVTFLRSLKALRLQLWHEAENRLVNFTELDQLVKARAT